MGRLKKIISIVVLVPIILLCFILAVGFALYPTDYTLRVLRWGNSDVLDYQKFPERPFPPAATPYHFQQNPNEALVSSIFINETSLNQATETTDFDSFLEETGTQAFIVIQDDTILYEKYFNGTVRDSIVTSFSVAKSFTSALIGIAISEGHIDSVNDPITLYLPELLDRNPAFADISIQDLLMMSSGIRYEEFPFLNGDDAKTYYYPDLHDLALNQTRITGTPGESFHYNNYHPLLLGVILFRETDVSVADYLGEKIWQPMGAEFAGSWSLDEYDFEKMESGINGRAIDFAKFGRLFLNKGNWNGTQLVPSAWVGESTTKQADVPVGYYDDTLVTTLPNGYYKYMWWGMDREDVQSDFSALGNHGQFIYISPHKSLIIVRFGETYGVNANTWINAFYDFASAIDNVEEE